MLQRNIIKRSFFTVVQQGTVGVREFLGRNKQLLKPGIRLKIPLVHLFRHIDLREDKIFINEAHAYTNDNVPIKVSGNLFFRIEDPLKSIYAVTKLRDSLAALGQSAVRSVVGTFEYDCIIKDRHQINRCLFQSIEHICKDWGVICEKFEMQEFGPQNNQVASQLERQLIAERERRENEYNTLAKIRTAEGLKQVTILKSEGDLLAKKNEADGEAYVIETKTRVLKDQIKNISDVFNNSHLAGTFLLEKERLNHLSSIASGVNNSTYFIPNDFNSSIPIYSTILGDNLKK